MAWPGVCDKTGFGSFIDLIKDVLRLRFIQVVGKRKKAAGVMQKADRRGGAQRGAWWSAPRARRPSVRPVTARSSLCNLGQVPPPSRLGFLFGEESHDAPAASASPVGDEGLHG